jgi:predicted 3-demethylubiquinone-9 3-methyltransferase (glyoxalase superfamily)
MSIVKVAVVVTTGLLIEAAFERLEPCVEKLTSTVLMGLGLSNEPRLPNKLSADPKAEQCGWLKDKYGLSWQIVPTALEKMLQDKDPKKVARVTEAFLKMKKFDIKTLKQAYEGGGT